MSLVYAVKLNIVVLLTKKCDDERYVSELKTMGSLKW